MPDTISFRGATYRRVASLDNWVADMVRSDNFADERLSVKDWLQNLEVMATSLVARSSDDEFRKVLSELPPNHIKYVVNKGQFIKELVLLAADQRYNELSDEGKEELLDSPYFHGAAAGAPAAWGAEAFAGDTSLGQFLGKTKELLMEEINKAYQFTVEDTLKWGDEAGPLRVADPMAIPVGKVYMVLEELAQGEMDQDLDDAYAEFQERGALST